jgi:hypothetical protein
MGKLISKVMKSDLNREDIERFKGKILSVGGV